jgi:hypothetical protein
MLTGGGSMLLLALAAAMPGLCVLMLVGALGRAIFDEATRGIDDAPGLPGLQHLMRDALRFARDSVISLVATLGVPITVALCGGTFGAVLPGMLLGMFLAPITFVLRLTRGDLASLSPLLQLRALLGSRGYTGLALAVNALFTPAVLVAFATRGYPFWLQISAVGPLVVLPVFVSARLVGTFVAANRDALAGMMPLPALSEAPVAPIAPVAEAQPPVRRAAEPAPKTARAAAAAAPAAPATRGKPPSFIRRAQRSLPNQPRTIAEAHAVAAQKQVSPNVVAPAAATPARAAKTPVSGVDLTKLPGAVVVSGKDRQRLGASAPTAN